jgi:hypothetical protein
VVRRHGAEFPLNYQRLLHHQMWDLGWIGLALHATGPIKL